MKTYLHYLFSKLKAAWQEDKWQFYFISWLISIFVSIFIIIAVPAFDLGFEWWLLGLGIMLYYMAGCLYFSLPYWRDYLYWAWAIIKLPYTFAVWFYHLVQDSYRSYREWKGDEQPCTIREV